MNKPYFTKYIPVEGEINEKSIRDDEFFYTDGKIYKRLAGSWALHNNGTKSQYPVADRVQRVKLFLCSRDIQVGDEMIIDRPDRPSIHGTKTICRNIVPNPMIACDMLMLPRDHKMDHLSTGEAYKVIGEVSPYALGYVKEGMEFENKDQEELLFHYAHRSFRDKDFEDTDLWEAMGNREYDKYTITVKFKCPCCQTFK